MKSPILGQSYVARSLNASADRMINLYPEATPSGKETGFLARCPGLNPLLTVGVGPVRGIHPSQGFLFVVSGQELYLVTTAFAATLLGTIAGTGPVSMADNGTQVFIAADPKGYIATTGSVTEITDPDFPGAVTVGYLDGYFVFNKPDSQEFFVTSLLDGTQIDALEFASAEGAPDVVSSLIVDHREVWLFGTNSIEVWYNSGALDFPLDRIQGAFIETGCSAPYSIAKLDNSLFWLGSDARGNGTVYRANGYVPLRVSTHAIEYAIQSYGDISGAIGFSYQQEGHSFYVLNFPAAQKTWVFDAATNLWHERAILIDGEFIGWLPVCQANFDNVVVFGGGNQLFKSDLDYYEDKWLRSWRAIPTGQNTLKRTIHHSLQIDCEVGVGLDGTTQGDNPQMMLRWSDDGGHTWSNEHWVSMGRIGATGTRAIFRRLGATLKSRDRVYEISGTDPVKISIMGAHIEATGTKS